MAWRAVHEDDEGALISLIQGGVDLEQRGGNLGAALSTPLQHARARGNLSMMHLLLVHSVQLEAVQSGSTVLLQAVAADQVEATKLLLVFGANVNARHKPDEKTALHIASELRHVNMALIGVLIDAGVDMHAVDSRGWTALHYAVHENHRSLVYHLIQHGALLLARTNDGLTPADVARSSRKRGLAAGLDAIAAHRETVRKSRCHAFAAGQYNPRAHASLVHDMPRDIMLSIIQQAASS